MSIATNTPVFLYVTTATQDEARSIARTLLEENLIACANILGETESFFRWEGKIDRATEAVAIFKTGYQPLQAVIDRIVALHSYDCPCVVALPIADGYADFLRFLSDPS